MTRLTWFRATPGQSALLFGLLVCACHGEIESEPNDTDESLEALTPVTVTFRTELTGQYLCADQGGGGPVSADRTAPQAWETFKLLDLNDGALESNDLVYIEAQNGGYLQAAAGGGAALHAGRDDEHRPEIPRRHRHDPAPGFGHECQNTSVQPGLRVCSFV